MKEIKIFFCHISKFRNWCNFFMKCIFLAISIAKYYSNMKFYQSCVISINFEAWKEPKFSSTNFQKLSLAWKCKKIFLQSISTKIVQNCMLKVFDADWYHLQSWCNKILIKITQWHYGVRTFLHNGSTDFDEILHVAWEWLPEGHGTSGRSGYSPV